MGYVHNIDPVMVTIAGQPLYWYGFAYTFGFAVMILWFWGQRRLLGWTGVDVIETSILYVICILAGGRLFEIAVYEWEWYSDHLNQIPMLWKGGMATHGLLIGSVVASVITSLRLGTPLLRLLDCLTVAAAVIFGVGRLGNFIEGGVVGTMTDLPWGVQLPDVDGFRHPVSLYDGLKNLLMVPVLIMVLRRWPAGRAVATAVFLLLYGGLRFVVDQFRDYESVLWGLGTGQWFNLAMAFVGAVILVIAILRPAGVPATPRMRFAVRTGGVAAVESALLIALILFPLVIPTSWTTEYLHQKRGSAPTTLVTPPSTWK
jgi:phosphatidylglycerol---prolipoprotein diacylglyceryl transferase